MAEVVSEAGVDNNAVIVVMEVLLVFTFHFPCNVFHRQSLSLRSEQDPVF